MDNRTLAERIRDRARALESLRANLYRVQAYRRAAETLLRLDQPVSRILASQGRDGLRTLPGIGPSLSNTIDCLVRTGKFPEEGSSGTIP